MTIAELARFFNDELHIGADLHLVRRRTVDERFGRPATREALLRGEDAAAAVARDDDAVAAWRRQVAPHLIYR